jgi:hypothetical protein
MGTGPDVDCEAELSVKHPLFPREGRGKFESKYKPEKYALPEPTGFAGIKQTERQTPSLSKRETG